MEESFGHLNQARVKELALIISHSLSFEIASFLQPFDIYSNRMFEPWEL